MRVRMYKQGLTLNKPKVLICYKTQPNHHHHPHTYIYIYICMYIYKVSEFLDQ